MDSRMEERGKIRVSLILSLIDDYSGKRIVPLKNMQVCVKGAGKPILKREGYYIFTNLLEEIVSLFVSVQGYQVVERELDLKELDKKEPLVKIRLWPTQGYPFLEGMTILTGRGKAGMVVRAVSFQSQHFYRFNRDYKKSDKKQIGIVYSECVDLEGKYLAVWQKGRLDWEEIRIGKNIDFEQGIFEMEQELEREYQRGGVRLFPFYWGQADQEGRFWIVIGELERGTSEVQIEVLEESGKIKRFGLVKVLTGKENDLGNVFV